MKLVVCFCGRGFWERVENSCSDIFEEFFDILLEWREFNVCYREVGILELVYGYFVVCWWFCFEVFVRSCKLVCVNWFCVICLVNFDD